MKLKKRILSLLLCGAMLFSLCSQSVLAEENGQAGGVTIGTSGLCEHHPEHNADCGYTEGTAGTPCVHEHTVDCYEEVTNCVHEHDEDCYPEESVSGNEATPSGAQKREPENCPHICDEESGCITKELNCQHEHDDECGYSPATAGTPCGYVCELCGSEDSEKLATPSNAEAVTVASVQAMIDGLPNAEEITEDNAEEVKAQLEAIDEAKEKLSDEEIDELDMTRYAEAAAALGALAAPMLLANDSPDEQFSLKPGDTYYFDLSGANIPGTANGSLPDNTLHYVPFTYAGTVDAYKLTSATATTEEYAQQNKYPHSLFVADYAVTHTISWGGLNDEGLIFGKNYASGGVDYTLRAPSCGSGFTGSGDSECGTPQSNEWDAVLDKNSGYIQNWNKMYSWGQDTSSNELWYRAVRGYSSARYWNFYDAAFSGPRVGFRPVLEILNADTLGPDGLKVVTLDLGGGKLGGSSDAIHIIVKTGSTFTAPASDGLTRPDGDAGSFFMWLGSDGKLYDPGDNVPADVTKLTAQFASSSHSVTITTATLPDGKVGEAYSQTLIATGTTPITWSIIGALPDGLSLNKDTGKISGTPTAAGSSTFTVKATNSAGSDTKELSITITKDAPPAHEHSYGDWRKDGTSHWHECTDDDCPNREESINDKAAHVYDDDADTTCDVCGYERTVTPPSHEHSYGDWRKDGTNHWHECTDDDCPDREESIKDKAAHVYTDDADTTCDTCGYERTITPPAHKHSYGDWRKDGTNHWHECTDADCPNREESIKDKAAHVYDNDADTTCNTCGYERTVTPPAHEHIVTFDGNGGTSSVGSMTTTNQKLTSLPSASRSGSYSFDGWYTEKSGGTKITTDTVFSANTTVYAHWIYTSGSSSSEDRDDPSDNAFITDRPNKDNPTTPTTAKSNSVKVDSEGNAVITRSIVADVISVAQTDSIKHGNTKNGIAVVVPVEISKALAGVQITLKADALDKLVSSGVKRFTIDTDSMADFGFMLDTLKELNRQTTGDLILKMKKTAVTSQEVETAIGNRPVYDITLWEVKNGKETAVNLSGKTVSIAIPYTPAKNEKPGNLYAVYVDENGNVQWISKSSYNMDQKAVIFVAEHFSIYGIGYKNQIPAFTDVNNHWAKDNMLFVVSRGLLSGTSATTFSPNTGMTRGMFVTALGRLAGVDPTDYQASMFTDVKEDAYYAPYVNWAAKTGVVSGTTDTTFAPDTNINREQMAVIMKNYATKLGYTIPKTLEVVNFADSAGISSWAKEAVKSMQQAGILAGKTNNCFDPAGTATRAEVATVLRRFVEIVIDPQTANGWVQNDSGEWSYYKNGDLVKGWLSNDQKWYWLDKNTGKMFSGGWKQIDGKQYYFYADGSMAVNTTVDGKTIGADGARK